MGELILPVTNMRELFERIKTMNNLSTDKECWELISISEGFFKYVKKGKKHLSNDKAAEIASKAFLSVEAVLVLVNRQKAVSDNERQAWNNIMHGQCHNNVA